MTEFVIALASAGGLGFALRRLAFRLGALDQPDRALKSHVHPVPYLGGIAVAGGIAMGLAVKGWPLSAGLTAALFVPLVIGLVDDWRGVSATVRLGVQIGLGVMMVEAGLSATALPGVALAWIGAVVLYVVSMNAVNLVDGIDGLAGGVGAISAAGVALVAAAGGGRSGVLPVALAAGALGFLVHNAPRARLFLGDNGAYLVGAALAIAVLQSGTSLPALAGAVSCLGLFLLDLMLAILRRATGRAPLFAGDRGHIYDQLIERGLSVPACLALCYAMNAVLAGVGVGAAHLGTVGALALTGATWIAALAGLVAFGFVTYRAQVVDFELPVDDPEDHVVNVAGVGG